MKASPIDLGVEGADTDAFVTESQTTGLVRARKRFLMRCVDHPTRHDADPTADELRRHTRAGLAVMLYGFFRQDWSKANAATGDADAGRRCAGAHAADYARGCVLWTDYEGDLSTVSFADLFAYARADAARVKAEGYSPGAYVGIGTPAELIAKLLDLGYEHLWHSGSIVPETAPRPYGLIQERAANVTIPEIPDGSRWDLDTIPADSADAGMLWCVASDDELVVAPPAATVPPLDPAVPTSAANAPALPDAPPGFQWVDAKDASEDEIREYIASTWRPFAGLSAAPATMMAFSRIVCPREIEGDALSKMMLVMWCCALSWCGVVRVLLQRCSAELFAKLVALTPWAWKPYEITMAMANAQQIAEAIAGEHVRSELDIAKGKHPKKGDSILIDGGYHDVGCITGDVVIGQPFPTVEGGDQVKGFMAISAGERILLADGSLHAPASGAVHSIYKWIDMFAFMRAAGVKVLVAVPAPVVVATPTDASVPAPAGDAVSSTATSSPGTSSSNAAAPKPDFTKLVTSALSTLLGGSALAQLPLATWLRIGLGALVVLGAIVGIYELVKHAHAIVLAVRAFFARRSNAKLRVARQQLRATNDAVSAALSQNQGK